MDSLDSLPSCALSCLFSAISNSTCSLTDFDCICADTELNAALTPCIAGSCTIKEALTAQNFSYTTCDYPANENTTVYHIINIVGIVVAIIAVALRVTNRIVGGQIGLDDHTIILALFVAVAIAGVGFPLRTYGLGKNIWSVPFDHISETLKLFFVEENLYCVCISLIKASMLLLYLRLFPSKKLRLAVFIALAITIAWGAATFLAQLFSCSPINYFWNKWDGEHEGHCSSHNALLLAHAILNIVMDVVVIGIPMPILFKLHMSLEKRIGMCVMFAVGIVVTVISIFRLVEAVGFNNTMNPTKDFVPVGMWSLLEIDIGIMCACMPGIRALCKRLHTLFFPKPLGYETYEARSQSKNTGSSRDQYGSKQFSSSKSSTGGLESGIGGVGAGAGQFIRLKELGPHERDADDDRWPLRDAPAHSHTHSQSSHGHGQGPQITRQESMGRLSMGRDRESLGVAQGWHTQYPASPSPTRLKPPPLTPTKDSTGGLFSGKKSRANSMHFTWFRDGDSSS
ncbi:CFEM domain-containing protein [Aspergillus granulosus]|uniref:CFEM domain-containing protein n=1 Tax=Aspergillus granulosus TaxID=176169 RepID=A0ABR4HE52_9EURO